jgi:hypothetical protein
LHLTAELPPAVSPPPQVAVIDTFAHSARLLARSQLLAFGGQKRLPFD